MNWTEPKPPTQGISHYDHVICETPLGQALIEWKGWKESDSYSLTIGNDYVGEGWDLDDAKRLAKEWLTNKHIQSFNEHQENLNISDVSDSDFILNEIKTILKNKEEEMLWYIKEYFTRSETDRHSENLLRMVGGYEGDIASIRMKLIARNP